MADQPQSTHASDGSIGVFPGESGMVGTPNAAGKWAMWMPRVGVTYSAEYWGRRLSVKNIGSGQYELTRNGIVQLCDYSSQWVKGAFYDAAGNEVSSAADALAPGNPAAMFFNVGRVVASGDPAAVTAQNVVTQTAVTNQTSANQTPRKSGAPDPATTRTKSSDGRTDVYAGDSGMVGMYDAGRDAWYIFMPPPGIDYASFYWGGDIGMKNNGDGTYWLDADGVRAKRYYAQRWQPGQYYDRNGSPVASAAQAVARGDPADVFFVPGQPVSASSVTQGNSKPPVTSTPLPPIDVSVTVAAENPDVVYVGNTGAGVPINTDFPTDPNVSGGSPTNQAISGKMLALAAAAAFALLS